MYGCCAQITSRIQLFSPISSTQPNWRTVRCRAVAKMTFPPIYRRVRVDNSQISAHTHTFTLTLRCQLMALIAWENNENKTYHLHWQVSEQKKKTLTKAMTASDLKGGNCFSTFWTFLATLLEAARNVSPSEKRVNMLKAIMGIMGGQTDRWKWGHWEVCTRVRAYNVTGK